jgi:biotin transport system permease protein
MLTLTSPVETWLHPVGAGWKLLALCVFTFALFLMDGIQALVLALAFVVALQLPCGVLFLRTAARLLWPLWPFVGIVLVWHLWIAAPAAGATVVLRLVAAVGAANLVTMTTRLTDMIAVVEWLARPLGRAGLSPRLIALSIALVIRFIPVLSVRALQLSEAWRARSPRRSRWPLLVPVTLAALDDAEHVAEALRARGGAG